MFERTWRDGYLLYCTGWCIIRKEIQWSAIWYIACADWLIWKSMTDICVILPPNFSLVRGYPHISGTNIEYWYISFPIFVLVTSQFIFRTYQSIKKLVWVSSGGGCLHGDQFWPMDYNKKKRNSIYLHIPFYDNAFGSSNFVISLSLKIHTKGTFYVAPTLFFTVFSIHNV